MREAPTLSPLHHSCCVKGPERPPEELPQCRSSLRQAYTAIPHPFSPHSRGVEGVLCPLAVLDHEAVHRQLWEGCY